MTPNPDVKSGRTPKQQREIWAESFKPVLSELRLGLQKREVEQVVDATGAAWDSDTKELRLPCLDEQFRIGWPELVAYPLQGDEPCPANLQGLFLYYLSMADGTPLANRWISFRELPDGWLYHQAFQGYTGDEMVRALGNRIEGLDAAATALGGWEQPIGDVGYAFDMLPRVRCALVYWLGDDEFPPQAQVLFDEAASHYLPPDGLAMLGSRLVHRLLRGMS